MSMPLTGILIFIYTKCVLKWNFEKCGFITGCIVTMFTTPLKYLQKEILLHFTVK